MTHQVPSKDHILVYDDPEDMLTEDELLDFDRGDWHPEWVDPSDFYGDGREA